MLQSWLGGEKIKALIPMSKVVAELEKANAPKSEIEKYIRLVDDPIERRNLEARLAKMQL